MRRFDPLTRTDRKGKPSILSYLSKSHTFHTLRDTPQTSSSESEQGDKMTTSKSSPTELYQRLINDSRKHRILFRVHDSTSASPLTWTGEHSTSGFSSLNPNLQHLTPTAYMSAFGRLTGYSWLLGPYSRDLLVRHIFESPGSGIMESDELSPWISTTLDFDWAVWEVARRLAKEEVGEVKMAIIRQAHLGAEADDEKQRNGDEIRIDPLRILGQYLEQPLDRTERQHVLEAKRRAVTSSEVLFYGRIFSSSIESDLIFTREVGTVFYEVALTVP